MDLIYLGVDIAGARNTWVAGLAWRQERLEVAIQPHLSTLEQIVDLCLQGRVVGAAIDAQLSMSLAAETGFRQSDLKLREMLPVDCRNWVSSLNSLMAVPVRGLLLGQHLAPLVGTLLETHPRACLYFGLGPEFYPAVRAYKSQDAGYEHIALLWAGLRTRFRIASELPLESDGALDALVCATVVYLYHHDPASLLRLDAGARDLRGYGPFYVLAPDAFGW